MFLQIHNPRGIFCLTDSDIITTSVIQSNLFSKIFLSDYDIGI